MKKLFGNFEEIVAGFFLIITVSSVVLNVFCRSIGLGTISTSEEIATISFVWSVYIGAVACYKRKMHIGVDMLVQMFSKKGRNIRYIFSGGKLCNTIFMCDIYNEFTRKANSCFRNIIKLSKYGFAYIVFLDNSSFSDFSFSRYKKIKESR